MRKRAEMTRRGLQYQVAAKVEITNVDARNYYDKNAHQIATELHLGVISFNNKEGAEEALQKIRGGATFNPSPEARWGVRCQPDESPGTWGSYPGPNSD